MRAAALAGILAVVFVASCSQEPEKPAAPPPKPAYGSFGVDLTQMDTSVRPGDDFYRYVNGKWTDTAQIPPDKSYYGTIAWSGSTPQRTRRT